MAPSCGISLPGIALERVVVFVGPFGSGKSELAINLALQLASHRARISLADLDVVNPYFRCREVRGLLERHGVGVFAPPPEAAFVDLPIVAPGVCALIQGDGPTILDVGGDAAGARMVRLFAPQLARTPHDVLFVVNARRPYAADVETAYRALRGWEEQAGTRVTAVVANAHLLDESDEDAVRQGLAVARGTAGRAGLRVAFVGALAPLACDLEGRLDAPILGIARHLLPPHARRDACRV